MDSGCVAPGEKFEEDYNVSRRLLPEEVLGIIDELICHEVCLTEHRTIRAARTLTVVDFMAPRLPSITNAVHQRICRGTFYARPCQYWRGPVC